MKEFCLDFFKNFSCVGGSCTHNCCLLWEIDVDKKTLNYYKRTSRKKHKYSVEFCEKLKNCIDYKKRCFILQQDKEISRCPFLNADNLCEIHINLGKDKLCQVCTDHPRFRNYYPDRIEWGVGLCCPESAKKIMSCTDRACILEKGAGKRIKKLTDFEKEVLSFRKKVLDIVQNRDLEIIKRFELVLNLCNVSVKELKSKDWGKVLKSLEILDKNWINYVDKINVNKDIDKKFGVILEQLSVYFVFRYLITAVDRFDLKSKTVFAILSVLLIYSMSDGDESGLREVAIRYSQEIEYSQENMSKILDITDGVVAVNEKV